MGSERQRIESVPPEQWLEPEGDNGIEEQTKLAVSWVVGQITDRCMASPHLAGMKFEEIAAKIMKGIQEVVTSEMLVEDMEETAELMQEE